MTLLRNSRFSISFAVAAGVAVVLILRSVIASSWTHLVIAGLCGLFIIIGFDKTRARAPWARFLFAVTGLLGIAYAITAFLIDSHTVKFSRADIPFLPELRGLILGFLGALLISGQLLGKKPSSP